MTGPDHLADIAALRRLHGQKVDRTAEIHEACRALEAMTAPWRAFRLSPTRIADALRQTEGIAAALRAMRDDGGPADAA